MTAVDTELCPTVDLIFPLSGRFLPRDHAHALKDALCRAWPWLEAEPHDVPLDVVLTEDGVHWQRPGL